MKKVFGLFFLYVVMITAANPSFAQPTSGTLPVLINVDAGLTEGNKVFISWTILQKVNTDCFDVEKSNDGLNWHSIVTVKATTSPVIPFTYSMLDAAPLKGSNLYRIRIRDLNGNTGITVAKNVWVNASGGMTVYPNPSTDRVNISLGQVPDNDWTVVLTNSQGQVLLQKKYAKNITVISLPVNSFPCGNYFLEIIDGNTRQCSQLMINRH